MKRARRRARRHGLALALVVVVGLLGGAVRQAAAQAPAGAPVPMVPVAAPTPEVAPLAQASAPVPMMPATAPAPAASEVVVEIEPAPPEPAMPASSTGPTRTFAGSIQLDFLGVPTERLARKDTLDGATVELSLKLAVAFNDHVSASVKVCVACHGPELGMAFFDLRVADELNVRVGRFTPAFGSFPVRHDPANHRTSDKPLPYDMGRMLHYRDWNEGILPAPWVDNGVELNGAKFFDGGQLDYAAYAVGGPKGTAASSDFDFTLSRSGERYYVDNNSTPTVGARLGATLALGDRSLLSLGASGMAGHYDPDARLGFAIGGVDAVLQVRGVFLRAEYLVRRTEIDLGADPATRWKYGPTADGRLDAFTRKDGFYAELEVPVGPVDLIARWDGLRRWGNVLATSALRSESAVLRSTAALAYRMTGNLRLKASVELYDFSDFDDELAIHLGIASPF